MLLLVSGTTLFMITPIEEVSADPIYPDDMIAYWTFDEGSGNTAHDVISGYDGTIHGATWTNGKVGGGLYFDGTNDLVIVPDGAYDTYQYGTLEFWYQFDPGQQGVIMAKDTNPVNGGTFNIAYYGNYQNNGHDKIAFLQTHYNYHVDVGVGRAMDADNWHHVAVVFDPTGIKSYFDGQLDAYNDTYTNGWTDSSFDLVFGAIDSTRPGCGPCRYVDGFEQYFKGHLDEIALYSRALTADEIQQHYASGDSYAATVPEPTTMLFLGTGLLGLAGARRKMKK